MAARGDSEARRREGLCRNVTESTLYSIPLSTRSLHFGVSHMHNLKSLNYSAHWQSISSLRCFRILLLYCLLFQLSVCWSATILQHTNSAGRIATGGIGGRQFLNSQLDPALGSSSSATTEASCEVRTGAPDPHYPNLTPWPMTTFVGLSIY